MGERVRSLPWGDRNPELRALAWPLKATRDFDPSPSLHFSFMKWRWQVPKPCPRATMKDRDRRALW